MNIIVNEEEAEEQERELERAIRSFILRWVARITLGIVGIIGIAILIDKADTPEKAKPSVGWKGLDPSRDAHEIKHWDMATREVEYYKFNPPSTHNQVKRDPSRVEIRINKSQKVILEGITQEEVLEGLDMDYEDIRDYYGGDELR